MILLEDVPLEHSRKENAYLKWKSLYIDKHKRQNIALKLNSFV